MDRPVLDARMLGWLREFASAEQMVLIAVSQVAEDDVRTRALAAVLGSEMLCWDARSSNEQEALLRDLYRRTALVWSDRLHVLVLGALNGAVPIEIVGSPNGKIARHFDAVGLEKISFAVDEISSYEALAELLLGQLERAESVASSVAAARISLRAARLEMLPASGDSIQTRGPFSQRRSRSGSVR